MDIKEVRANLNKRVMFTSQKVNIENEYILTACIFRKDANGFYYQVELKDPKANSVIIAKLDDIQAV